MASAVALARNGRPGLRALAAHESKEVQARSVAQQGPHEQEAEQQDREHVEILRVGVERVELEDAEHRLDRQAVESVVETMFYAEAEYRGQGPVSAPAVVAIVEFTGPMDGAMQIFVEESLAGRFTADFTAVDASRVDAAMSRQTVTELANIVCARILKSWLPDSSFRYSLPVLAEPPDPGARHRFTFSAGSREADLAAEADLAVDVAILK